MDLHSRSIAQFDLPGSLHILHQVTMPFQRTFPASPEAATVSPTRPAGRHAGADHRCRHAPRKTRARQPAPTAQVLAL
jgi:hypothetical protein